MNVRRAAKLKGFAVLLGFGRFSAGVSSQGISAAQVGGLVRTLLCLVVMLGVLSGPALAYACKCAAAEERDLAERYTVFVGTAVEYLERSDDGSDPSRPSMRANAAVRFEVHYSRDVPVGSSQIVMLDIHTSCATFFAVGERHLVLAFRAGELLTASECPSLFGELESKLLAQLRVPAGFLPPRSRGESAKVRCDHPRTLDQAFAAADVVGWWDAKASCVASGGDEVEHAAVMRWAWKGLGQGKALRLRVAKHGGEPAPPPFYDELATATDMSWPPADLLRRDGDTFINDGCLVPLAPPSLEVGKEAVLRLFPLPAGYRLRRYPRTDPPLPTLSCMTLDVSVFVAADATLARYVHSRESESARELQRGATPPRGRSCAACALTQSNERPHFAWLVLALAPLARRRARAKVRG